MVGTHHTIVHGGVCLLKRKRSHCCKIKCWNSVHVHCRYGGINSQFRPLRVAMDSGTLYWSQVHWQHWGKRLCKYGRLLLWCSLCSKKCSKRQRVRCRKWFRANIFLCPSVLWFIISAAYVRYYTRVQVLSFLSENTVRMLLPSSLHK
jgi:hypothetical protein